MEEPDDLDLSIQRRAAKDPTYIGRLDAEVRRQRLVAAGTAARKSHHLTQAAVAKAMGVSQSMIAEIEAGKADVRYSTLDRYLDIVTLGSKHLELVPS